VRAAYWSIFFKVMMSKLFEQPPEKKSDEEEQRASDTQNHFPSHRGAFTLGEEHLFFLSPALGRMMIFF